jgi:group I intron endonuclease
MPEKFNTENLRAMKPAICGIYAIVGPDGRRYIGQGVDVTARLKDHLRFLVRGKHWNVFLQRTWDKHGAISFTFELVQKVRRVKSSLEKAEQFWMDHYRALDGVFNARPAAGSMLGHKHGPDAKTGKTPKSKEHRESLSLSKKGVSLSKKNRRGIKAGLARRKALGLPVGYPKGKPISEEEKLRRQRNPVWLDRKHSKKTKNKMSDTRRRYYEDPVKRTNWSAISKAIWVKRRANKNLVNGQRKETL